MDPTAGSGVNSGTAGGRSSPGVYVSQSSASGGGKHGSVSEPSSLRGTSFRVGTPTPGQTAGSVYGTVPAERSRYQSGSMRATGLNTSTGSGQQSSSRPGSTRSYDFERNSSQAYGQARAQSARLGSNYAGLDPYGALAAPTGAPSASAAGLPPAPMPDVSAAYAKPRTEGGFLASTQDSWKAFKARVKSDVWKVAVVKATNHVVSEPKEKHVQVILRGTYMGGNIMDKLTPTGAILHQLGKRLQWKDWIVVLKSMLVFHRIFQDGNPAFTSFLANNASNVFRFHGYIEQTSDAIMNMPVILSYSQYLERWCLTKQKIDWPERIQDTNPYAAPGMAFMASGVNTYQTMPPGASQMRDAPSLRSGRLRGPSRFEDCDFLQLISEVPYLQDNLDLLLAVRLEFGNASCLPARGAVRLCLRDLAELLPALSRAVQNLVEQFYSVDAPEILESAFEIYRRYLDQDIGVAQYLKQCQSVGVGQPMPNVARPSQSVLDEMFDHLERVKMGDIPRIRGDELDSSEQEIMNEKPQDASAESSQLVSTSRNDPGMQKNEQAAAQIASVEGTEAHPMDASSTQVVAATQTETGNEHGESRVIGSATQRALNQTEDNTAVTRVQTGASIKDEGDGPQLEQADRGRQVSRKKVSTAPPAVIEKKESAKPKEFDLLALLEGSSDSDDQIESESDSSTTSANQRSKRGVAPRKAAGTATASAKGKRSTDGVDPRHRTDTELVAPSTEQFAYQAGGYGMLPPYASHGAYPMYPPPPVPGAFPGVHPGAFGPPGYPPQFYAPPVPHVQSHGTTPQSDLGNGPPSYYRPQLPPMQQYPMAISPLQNPALPPPFFTGASMPQSSGSGGSAAQTSFMRDQENTGRKVTPADQHFFDLFEEAMPKK
jgi:hypothetical protein